MSSDCGVSSAVAGHEAGVRRATEEKAFRRRAGAFAARINWERQVGADPRETRSLCGGLDRVTTLHVSGPGATPGSSDASPLAGSTRRAEVTSL